MTRGFSEYLRKSSFRICNWSDSAKMPVRQCRLKANLRETCSSFVLQILGVSACNPIENIFDRRVYKLNQGVIDDDQRLQYNMRLDSFWSEDEYKSKEKNNNKWSTTRGFSIENVKSVLNWGKQSQSGQLQRRGTRKGVTESHTQQDVGSTTYLSAQVELLKWNSWTQLAFVGIPIVEITFGWEQVKCVQKIVIALSDLR